MEAAGLQAVVPRLMQNPKIVGYVHDNDGKARTIPEQFGWHITEYLDPGHAKKSFENRFQNFQRNNGRILKRIESQLLHWMWILIHSNYHVRWRVFFWQNALNHFCGNHFFCLHAPIYGPCWDQAQNPVAQYALKKFLDDTQFIIEKCDGRYNTQSNESLHRKKLKYATKDVRWGFSWHARMMCAVLSKNLPGWKWRLYDALGLDELPAETQNKLVKKEIEEYGRSILVKTFDYRSARNTQRKRLRLVTQAQQRQRNPLQYGPNPYMARERLH